MRLALTGLVLVEAGVGLLTVAAFLVELGDDVRGAERRLGRLETDLVEDVESGKIERLERPDREAEVAHDGVDLTRQRALFEQITRLPGVVEEHAIADEAERVAGNDALFLQRLGDGGRA